MNCSKNTLRSLWRIVVIALLLVSAGCSALDTGSEADATPSQYSSQPTPESVENPAVTVTFTPDPTPAAPSTSRDQSAATPTPAPSTREPSQREKYETFVWSYSGALGDSNVSVTNSSIDASNESITITYLLDLEDLEMQDFALIQIYAFLTENYRTNTFESVDESYVPERVNHRAVLERDGEVYRTTYVNESMANKFLSEEWNQFRYWAEFIQTLEYGPGSPHYTPSTTEAEPS